MYKLIAPLPLLPEQLEAKPLLDNAEPDAAPALLLLPAAPALDPLEDGPRQHFHDAPSLDPPVPADHPPEAPPQPARQQVLAQHFAQGPGQALFAGGGYVG